MQRRAEAQAKVRAQDRDPQTWGVSAQIVRLPTAADVAVVTDAGGAVLRAWRSDPFDLLLAAGGLDEEQHRAARRLMRDWCIRQGIRDAERQALERVDGGRPDPTALINDAMVDAGRRIQVAMRGDTARGITGVGPVNQRLLDALISPMVTEGRTGVWRHWVEQATGVTNKDAQGPLVRMACEALRLVYAEVDAQRRREQLEREAQAEAANRTAIGGAAA